MNLRRILATLLFAAPAALAQYNPSPGEYLTSGYSAHQSPCCGADCESLGTCNLPPCSSTNSVYFSLNLGRTPFERQTDPFRSAAIQASTIILRSTPAQSFDQISAFYRQGEQTGRRSFRLWVAQQDITSLIYGPDILVTDPEATCEKILSSGGATGAIRQIVTDDILADIQPLTPALRTKLPSDIDTAIPAGAQGFAIRMWFAKDKGTKSGFFYPDPVTGGSVAIAPLGYCVFYNPDSSVAGKLNIIHRVMFDDSGNYKTRSFCHYQNATTHDWETTVREGLPAATVVEKTTLAVTSWTSALNHTVTRTVQQAALSPAGVRGALQTVSIATEDFDDIGGVSRLVSKIEGTGTTARTTTYAYYNTPAFAATHGMLKYQVNPDHSFVYHEYTFDFTGQTATLVTKTPWKDYLWTPGATAPATASCLTETTTIGVAAAGKVVRTRQVGSVVVAEETEQWTSSGGYNLFTQSVRCDASSYLTTVSAFHPSTAGHQANRLAWRTLPDGTVEKYTYTSPDSAGNYSRTEEKGAGTTTTVSSGTRVIRAINGHGVVEGESDLRFGSAGAVGEVWQAFDPASTSSTIVTDIFGRPKGRKFNANPADYDQTTYGCCGINSFRDRRGIVSQYYRDDLKRVYSKVVTSGSDVVTTGTDYNGLITTVKRQAGSGGAALDLLVSKTHYLDNGELEKSYSADEDNDGGTDADGDGSPVDAELTTYATAYPSGGGRSTTITYPDGGTRVSASYIDGRTKSVTGTAVADTTYDYGTHTSHGNGLFAQVTKLTNLGGTGEWSKAYFDPADRPLAREYPTQLASPGTNDSTQISYYGTGSGVAAGARGKLYQLTDPDGVIETYGYDAEGQRTTVSRTMPNGAGTRIESTVEDVYNDPSAGSYTGFGLAVRTVTSLNGVVTSTTLQSGDGYSRRSYRPSDTAAIGPVTDWARTIGSGGAWTETTRNPDGTLQRDYYVKGRLGATTQWAAGSTPDPAAPANITTVSTSGFIEGTAYTYHPIGRVTAMTDARTGATNYTAYTASGNLLSETDPGSRTTAYGYDSMGRRTVVDAPNTTISGGTVTLPNVTSTSYYPTGRIEAVWGDQTYATYRAYDEQNRLIQLRTYSGLTHGTKPTSTTAGHADTSWIYDSGRGWLANKRDAAAKGPDYTYTAAGRLKTRTWAGGKRTRYDYRQGMLVAKRYFTTAASDTGSNVGNDPVTPDAGFTYNAFGQPLNVVTSSTTALSATRLLYNYDTTNTLRVKWELQQIDPDLTFSLGSTDPGIVINYGVSAPIHGRYLHRKTDNLMRNTGADLRQSPTVSSTLDVGTTLTYHAGQGRLDTVTGDFNGATSLFNYTYVVNSSLVSTITGPAYLAGHAWDSTRDILTTRDNHFVTAYVYDVNDLGQRTATTYTSPRTWDYDAKGQVVSEQRAGSPSWSAVYEFDGIGNRKKSAAGSALPGSDNYTVNALNQYTAVAGASPAYDDDGNLTADGGSNIANVPRQYEWNGENQLSRVKTASTGAITTAFQYDAFGRRVVKTVKGAVDTSTIYLYDGWNLIAEYTTTGGTPVLARSHIWGTDLSGSLQGAGGVGGLLATRLVGSSATYYPCYDGNGNVTQYVDSSRATVASYEYSAYGHILGGGGGMVSSFDIRFSTKLQDPETGWYYYGYRYYDAYLGRWPSRDPIGERGGVNLYSFVENDGVGRWDVLGREKLKIRPPLTNEQKLERQQMKDQDNDVVRAKKEGALPIYHPNNSAEKNKITYDYGGAMDWGLDDDSPSFVLPPDDPFPSEDGGEEESEDEGESNEGSEGENFSPFSLPNYDCCVKAVRETYLKQVSVCDQLPEADRQQCRLDAGSKMQRDATDCTNYHIKGSHWSGGGNVSTAMAAAAIWPNSPNELIQHFVKNPPQR